ncbi:MAG: (d)CMP kinase [Ruthenibacterium lactatiformans]
MISIAIDGPSGAGKSSLSRRLAAELGYIYVDTGAMYRTIGLHVLRSGADTEDEDAVAALLPGIRLEMRYVDGVQHMFLNGEDVSGLIRTEEVSMAASHVSAHPSVRAFLLDAQRALAKDNNVLMDGRDIGTVVLPGAQVKIFLTASAGDRARRRYDELIARGEWVSYEQVLADVERRDYNVPTVPRAVAPAADAVTVFHGLTLTCVRADGSTIRASGAGGVTMWFY